MTITESMETQMLVDGRYRLELELGAGAFGSVHKAVQVVLDHDMRDVALKLFHSSAISARNILNVMNDAIQIQALLSQLTDWEVRQHFVTVYDLGVTREKAPRGYVSMELVRGGSLENRLRDMRRFTLRGTIHYLSQIARAVAYMHEQEVVHCDLKPANILVSRGLRGDLVKVGDFGLSGKYLGAWGNGPRGGTVSYQAPEALYGLATTPSCDVFAMGVMAYEMLRGENPYNRVGETLDPKAPNVEEIRTEMQKQSREVALRVRPADIPELAVPDGTQDLVPLLDVINKMLHTNPADRYASAVSVRDDIDRIMLGHFPSLSSSPTVGGGKPSLGRALGTSSSSVQVTRESPQNKIADPNVDPDPEVERFQYFLAKEDWPEATRVVGQIIRRAPREPGGYRLRSQLLLTQARRLIDRPNSEERIRQLQAEAIRWLNKALDLAGNERESRQIRHEIADVYQEMGDHVAAQQVRNMLK